MGNWGPGGLDTIPVIDLRPLWSGETNSVRRVAEQVRRASVETGFFYVTGHNVGRDLMRAVYFAARYFFNLPADTKRSILVNKAHRGYVPFAQTTQPGYDEGLVHDHGWAHQ